MLASLLAPLSWPPPLSFRRGASPLEDEAPAPPRLVPGGGGSGGRPAAPFTDSNPLSGAPAEAPPFWFFPNTNSAPPPKASDSPVGVQAIPKDALLSFALPAVKSMMHGAQRAGPHASTDPNALPAVRTMLEKALPTCCKREVKAYAFGTIVAQMGGVRGQRGSSIRRHRGKLLAKEEAVRAIKAAGGNPSGSPMLEAITRDAAFWDPFESQPGSKECDCKGILGTWPVNGGAGS